MDFQTRFTGEIIIYDIWGPMSVGEDRKISSKAMERYSRQIKKLESDIRRNIHLGRKNLLLNLGDVTTDIPSEVMKNIIHLSDFASAQKGSLVLCALKASYKDAFDAAHMRKRIRYFADEQTAIASFPISVRQAAQKDYIAELCS